MVDDLSDIVADAPAPPSFDPVLVDAIAALVKDRVYDRIACFSRDRFHALAVEILDLVADATSAPPAAVGEIAGSGDGAP